MSELVKTPQVVIDDAEIFAAHEGGKLSVELKAPLDTQRALSIAYTPGVAQVSRAIAADVTLAKKYTWANRLVAVVSDGSAVLGLGNIGAAAAIPGSKLVTLETTGHSPITDDPELFFATLEQTINA